MGGFDVTILNEAERRILAMLAGGHTAKSIAVETGVTVHAVNERLREARRKTGAGSSRELARILAAREPAQENRDEQIAMALARGDGEAIRTVRPQRATHWIGGFVVMIAILLAGLIAVVSDRHRAAATPTSDPLLSTLLDDAAPSTLEKYGRVRTEPRDGSWARQAEALLEARYGAVIGTNGTVRVMCGATICEVAGSLPPTELNKGVALNTLGVTELPKEKLFRFASFTMGPAAGRLVFVAYPERMERDLSAAIAPAPRVISTLPIDGARIIAGPFTLSVTFDRSMMPNSYSFTTPEGRNAYPDCSGTPTRSADERTFALGCTALPNRSYAVGFNTGQFHNFISLRSRIPAEPAVLHFSTR